jgi:hypothetical protein
MSSLREKLLAKKVRAETVEVDDCFFHVVGMQRKERSDYMAASRKKDGKLDTDLLESKLLSVCVRDPETDAAIMTALEWDEVPSHITSVLIQSVMRCCGFDNDDLGKKSDSTGATTT